MAFEQAEFGDSVHFDSRFLGLVGGSSGLDFGGAGARPALALVPDQFDDDPATDEDQWQERALCAQTDPEAFFPEKGGSTREAKRI
jgi:WhiB family redox-sensing transcriptional regulator